MVSMACSVAPILWGAVGSCVPGAEDMNAARLLVERIWQANGHFVPADSLVELDRKGAGATRLLQSFSEQRAQRKVRAPIIDGFDQSDRDWRQSTLRMLLTQASAVIVEQRRQRQMQGQDQTMQLAQQPLWKRQPTRSFAQMAPPC